MEEQIKVINILGKIFSNESVSMEEENLITRETGYNVSNLKESETKEDKTTKKNEAGLRILLTTFEGSKGLSGGRVFVTGLNNGDLPKDISKITDLEISKLLVALCRTRKCCYLISNKAIRDSRKPKNKSIFLSWVPDEYTKDLGYLKNADI